MDRYIDISMRKRETPVPAEEVTEAVLSTYGLSKTALMQRGNREAKDFWMHLLAREGGLTQREIGAMIGHSDGATVSRRLACVTSALRTDPEAAARYDTLHKQITNRKA